MSAAHARDVGARLSANTQLDAVDFIYSAASAAAALVVVMCFLPWYRLNIVYRRDPAAHKLLNVTAAPHSLSLFQGFPNALWTVAVPAFAAASFVLCIVAFWARHDGRSPSRVAATRIAAGVTAAFTLAAAVASAVHLPYNGDVATELGTIHQIGSWETTLKTVPIAAVALAGGSLVLFLMAVLLEQARWRKQGSRDNSQ
jgi:hypothetical protein